MIKSLVCCLMVALLCNTLAFAQDSNALKQRCEQIIRESFANLDEANISDSEASRMRFAPLQMVEGWLLKALDSDDFQTRCTAAEVLLQKSPMQFQQTVVKAMNEMELKRPLDIVRRLIVLNQMGDKLARRELQHWADNKFEKLEKDAWTCPMICVEPSEQAGKCSVCGMELKRRTARKEPSLFDWEARLGALTALQKDGVSVAGSANAIVVSDAPAVIRLHAAGLWTEENRPEAMPHIKVYLNSDLRSDALSLLGYYAAEENVALFKQIIDAPTADSFERMIAYQGLLRAGETEYLKVVRMWVDKTPANEKDKSNRIDGFYLLVDLGLPEDITRLEKLLDTELKLSAAESLLRSFAKRQKQGANTDR